MKIDNALHNVSGTRPQAKTGKAKERTADRAAQGVSDNVELTSESTLMQSLESDLAKLPAEDAGKVETVRQAISEGRFQVNEEAVADKLVEETMQTLQHIASKP